MPPLLRPTALALAWVIPALSACSDLSDAPAAPRPPAEAEAGQRALAAVGPCGLEVSKLNYNQVGADDGALELIELRVHGYPAGATFGDCGVTHVAPWEGGK